MSPARVLVSDGETRACVAAVWGLADAGFEVVAAAPRGQVAPAHWSRAVAQRVRSADPLIDEHGFVASIERAVLGGDIAVLVPGSDASLQDVSRARERLEPHVRLGLPAPRDVERS